MEIQSQLNNAKAKLNSVQKELSELYEVLAPFENQIESNSFIVNEAALSKTSSEHLEQVAQQIVAYRNLIVSALEEDVDIFDSHSFLKYFLDSVGLRCPQDMMESLKKDRDIVEVFNMEHIQIFRNMTFMRMCSYSLADVLTYEWPDLFERSQVITNALLETLQVASQNLETTPIEVKTHYMKERFSVTRRVHKVDFKFVAPLFDPAGNLSGYVSTSHSEIVDKKPAGHTVRFI